MQGRKEFSSCCKNFSLEMEDFFVDTGCNSHEVLLCDRAFFSSFKS